MAKVNWKGGTLLAPLPPVLVTCGEGEKANVLTIAWTGILNSDPPKTYISVRPSRHSYNIIKESGEFVINLSTKTIAKAVDYCGVHTGRKIDKFQKCHLTKEDSAVVKCPSIAECPLSLECKVTDIIPLGSHDMFMADIVNVNVDESLIDKNGKLHIDKAKLLAFAHGSYYELGAKIGDFGFAVKKKHKKPQQKSKGDKKNG